MAIKFDELLEALDPSLDEDFWGSGKDEFLHENFSEDNIDYIGEILSRYIRRNGWDSFFDYPVLAVRDNNGNNRHFVIKSNKNSIIITDEDYKPIYSHELNSNNDLKTIFNKAAKEIIKNVKRFKIVHVNETCEKELKEDLNNIDIINKKIIASCDPESTLIEVLNACGGNLNWTASDLGLTVDELKFAIKFYGLDQDFDSFSESLNEAKYWNNKQNTEFYNDIRYKVDGAVYQIMKDIFNDLKIDKLAAQVHNLVPEYDPSWATHKRDDDNNLRLHKVRTGLSASLLDELSDKITPGSLDITVNNLRKY